MDPITLAAILGLGSAVGTGIIGGVGANMAQWNKNKNRQPQPVPQPEPMTQPAPQPVNNISQPADVIRKRQMWSKPQQRAMPQPRPQMWSQGGAERGYSRNFAEGDDRDGLEQMIMADAMSSNPYAQAAAMGNMEQAMSDPTDYNARFYEICRQYGLI